MRRLRIPGAWYTDTAVTGEWAALIRDSRIATSAGDVPLCPGGNVLYLRMLMSGGVMYLAGQGHQDGKAYLWTGLKWLVCTAQTNGQKVVAFGPDGLYVCTTGQSISVYALDGTFLRSMPTPTGSGGIQFVTPQGEVVTGDTTYRADTHAPFLAEWNYAGGIYVGQSYVDGCVAVNGSTRAQLEPGNCTFTHLHRDGDALAVSMVKPEGAVCYWLTVRELSAFLPEPSATPSPVVITPNHVIIPPIQEPSPMQLPASVKAIRAAYVSRFPVPQGAAGEAFEEVARQWSIRFAEQVAHDIPNQGWGMKRADAGRPISKDTIAQQHISGRLVIWDLLLGTGTGTPTLVDEPHGEDVTGQVFVAVTPRNHLGTTPAPVPPQPPAPSPQPPAPAPDDLVLVQIRALLREIAADVAELKARPFPSYTGRTPLKAGGTLTLRVKD